MATRFKLNQRKFEWPTLLFFVWGAVICGCAFGVQILNITQLVQRQTDMVFSHGFIKDFSDAGLLDYQDVRSRAVIIPVPFSELTRKGTDWTFTEIDFELPEKCKNSTEPCVLFFGKINSPGYVYLNGKLNSSWGIVNPVPRFTGTIPGEIELNPALLASGVGRQRVSFLLAPFFDGRNRIFDRAPSLEKKSDLFVTLQLWLFGEVYAPLLSGLLISFVSLLLVALLRFGDSGPLSKNEIVYLFYSILDSAYLFSVSRAPRTFGLYVSQFALHSVIKAGAFIAFFLLIELSVRKKVFALSIARRLLLIPILVGVVLSVSGLGAAPIEGEQVVRVTRFFLFFSMSITATAAFFAAISILRDRKSRNSGVLGFLLVLFSLFDVFDILAYAYVVPEIYFQRTTPLLYFSILSYIVLSERVKEKVRLESRGQSFDMASRMSHDIKVPLLALRFMKKGIGSLDPEVREIYDSTLSMLERFSTDIVKSFKQEKIKADVLNAHIGNYFESCAVRLRVLAKARTINFKYEYLEDQSDPISGKACEMLGRLFENLASNAIDFSPSGATVEVRVGVKSGQIEIRVLDAGPGISQDLVIASQTGPVDSTKAGGSGIGLYSVHRSVRELGGEISFETGKQGGTSVTASFGLSMLL